MAVDPNTGAQRTVSTGGNLSLVAGMVVFTKTSGAAASVSDGGVPAATVPSPTASSGISSPVSPNTAGAVSTPSVSGNATAADDSASIVTVSGQSLPAPSSDQ